MSKSNVIAREELPDCERWEPASFDAPGRRGQVALTTAAQVERIHRQAQQDGRRAGYEEGRKRAAAEAGRIAAVAAAFTSETGELDQQIAQQTLDLALEVARQMLRGALQARPDLILPVVQEAIRSLPVLGEDRRLHLHPEDAELARSNLGESLAASGWKILEDSGVARGGCRACTSHGEVDATVDSRWRRIVASLGRDDAWLAPAEEEIRT
jgi:flagellar assembly protein FliH